jgi:biopolymer transport protein ExbD/biopolymer transport protein TolR
MAVGGSKGVKNDINITPLVDVVLVLLIIFMVVTPMLQRGKDVHLPVAKQTGDDKQQADPLVLSLTPDHKIWVESAPFDEDKVEERVATEMIADPNKRVLLKGDESLNVGDVRQLMDHAKKAGAKSVELAVEELKKK